MNPTVRQVHADAVLSNMSVAYLQSADAFVARQVFPVVPVQHKTDQYREFKRNAFFRDDMQRRAPATESAGGGFDVELKSYMADVWALHKDISDQERANADGDIELDRVTTEYLTQQGLIRLEKQWVQDYFGAGIWGLDLTGVAAAPGANQFLRWTDPNSTPVDNIEVARERILLNGYTPNTLVLGYRAFSALKSHPDIIDRIKYTTSDVVTRQLLASLFEVDRVLVATAVAATNPEGAAESYDFIFGKAALLIYAAPSPNLTVASGGYIMEWEGVSDGLGLPSGVSRFYIDELRADRFEIQMAWDMKLVAGSLGVFFDQVVP